MNISVPYPRHLKQHLNSGEEEEEEKNSINFYVKLNPKITQNFPIARPHIIARFGLSVSSFLSLIRLMTIERSLIMLVHFIERRR